MSSRFEVCTTCPAQCELFNAKDQLVALPQGERPITIPEIRAAVSEMLLKVKDKRHCPSKKLGQVKLETTQTLSPSAIVHEATIGPKHDITEIFFIEKARIAKHIASRG